MLKLSSSICSYLEFTFILKIFLCSFILLGCNSGEVKNEVSDNNVIVKEARSTQKKGAIKEEKPAPPKKAYKQRQLKDIVPKNQRIYFQIENNQYGDTIVFANKGGEIFKKIHWKDISPFKELMKNYDSESGLYFLGKKTNKDKLKQYLSPQDYELIPNGYIVNHVALGKPQLSWSENNLYSTMAPMDWGGSLYDENQIGEFTVSIIHIWNQTGRCIDSLVVNNRVRAHLTSSGKYLFLLGDYRSSTDLKNYPKFLPYLEIYNVSKRQTVHKAKLPYGYFLSGFKPHYRIPDLYTFVTEGTYDKSVFYFNEAGNELYYEYFKDPKNVDNEIEYIKKNWNKVQL